jgi:hypothetical protein
MAALAGEAVGGTSPPADATTTGALAPSPSRASAITGAVRLAEASTTCFSRRSVRLDLACLELFEQQVE